MAELGGKRGCEATIVLQRCPNAPRHERNGHGKTRPQRFENKEENNRWNDDNDVSEFAALLGEALLVLRREAPEGSREQVEISYLDW